MPRCYVSLGGNSGLVAETFDKALDRLRASADCSVVAVSRIHETAPVGEQAGGRFLNAAAALETALDPIALLDVLQSVEYELGRTRTVRWGPRTIDLDVLFYGPEVIDSPRLVVPHPAAWYRRFVLDPLVEIAPDLVHPIKQATIHKLRERLLVRPLTVALAGGDPAMKRDLIAALSRTFTSARFADWDLPSAGSIDPALIFRLGQPDEIHGSPAASFERLPRLSRLDASAAVELPLENLRHVVQSALG